MSATSPMALCRRIWAPSQEAIPADSCPRCWSAWIPRYARLAASEFPNTPKTPHSSWNLSSSFRTLSRMGGRRVQGRAVWDNWNRTPRNRRTFLRCRNRSPVARVESRHGRERRPDRGSADEAPRALPGEDEGHARRRRRAAARAWPAEPSRDAEDPRGPDSHERLAGARPRPAAERPHLEMGADRGRRGGGAAAALLEGLPRAAPGQGHERLPLRDHLVEDGRAVGRGAVVDGARALPADAFCNAPHDARLRRLHHQPAAGRGAER